MNPIFLHIFLDKLGGIKKLDEGRNGVVWDPSIGIFRSEFRLFCGLSMMFSSTGDAAASIFECAGMSKPSEVMTWMSVSGISPAPENGGGETAFPFT